MKCEFCGSELKDGVRKCKYCRMFLDGSENDQPEVECPECGCMIIEKAKICRFCGSEIEEAKGTIKKTTDTDDEGDSDLGKRNKDKKSIWERLKENFVLIVLLGLCIWGLKSCDYDATNIEISEDIGDNYRIRVSDDMDPTSRETELGDLKFIPTKKGYEVVGSVAGYGVVCNLDSDSKILDFVDGMKAGIDVYATGCSFVKAQTSDNDFGEFEDFDLGGEKTVGIFFDNSYADNGDKKTGPNTRMKDLQKYLTNDRFPDGTSIKFVIPYGNGEESKGAVLNEDEFYQFTIDSSKFEPSDSVLDGLIKYKLVEKGRILSFKGKSKILNVYGYQFGFGLENVNDFFKYDNDGTMCGPESDADIGGNDDSERKFVCKNAEEVFKKFLALYKRNYQNDDKKHRGHLLLNALKDNRDVFDWDDLYIFSDGEFEIGEAWSLEKTIKYYRYLSSVKESTLAEYPLTNFHVREFKYYGQDTTFTDFWNKTLEWVKKEKIKNTCENTKIHLIGFTNGFGGYENQALQILFDNCEIVNDK